VCSSDLWTKQANSTTYRYIGQLWKYLQLHKRALSESPCVICGDFNSNSIWDSWDRWWNHSDFVKELHELGLESVYHSVHGEEQGRETQKTFYLQKNIDKKYHIDYMFSEPGMIVRTTSFKVHDFTDWKELSDHVPIEWEFE
jgi:endonuclease/exonuclease/phosphatase family metal-dependent hydrolase